MISPGYTLIFLMSLFKDKFFPKSFDEFIIHKSDINKYKNLVKDNDIYNYIDHYIRDITYSALYIGEIINILVGQIGGYQHNYDIGGGGGTFVTTSGNEPIIIAAGGGGGAPSGFSGSGSMALDSSFINLLIDSSEKNKMAPQLTTFNPYKHSLFNNLFPPNEKKTPISSII